MKNLALLLVILTIATLLTIPTLAASSTDSLRLSSDEVELLKKNPYAKKDEIIIKSYFCRSIGAFANKYSIEDTIASDDFCRKSPTYVHISSERQRNIIQSNNNGISFYRYYEKENRWTVAGTASSHYEGYYLEAILLAEDLLNTKYPGVKLQNLYLLNDGYEDICIYYVTDQGDYVYFREYFDATAYLFTLDEFYDFAEKVDTYRTEHGHLDGGVSIEGKFDLSAHEVTFPASPNTADHSLDILLAALAGGAALTTLRRKRQ